MKCLVDICHPLKDSLCHYFAEHVLNQLAMANHKVSVLDLYASEFQPTLSARERSTYYTDSYDTSAVEKHVDQLTETEALVLVYPTWWFSFPALLKGWFDRVWGPGVAYDHASDYGPIKPRLKNLQKALVVTSLGAPWWVDRIIMRQPLKRVLKLAILGSCAQKVHLNYLSLYQSENMSPVRVERFLQKVSRSLRDWDSSQNRLSNH